MYDFDIDSVELGIKGGFSGDIGGDSKGDTDGEPGGEPGASGHSHTVITHTIMAMLQH